MALLLGQWMSWADVAQKVSTTKAELWHGSFDRLCRHGVFFKRGSVGLGMWLAVGGLLAGLGLRLVSGTLDRSGPPDRTLGQQTWSERRPSPNKFWVGKGGRGQATMFWKRDLSAWPPRGRGEFFPGDQMEAMIHERCPFKCLVATEAMNCVQNLCLDRPLGIPWVNWPFNFLGTLRRLRGRPKPLLSRVLAFLVRAALTR